MVWGAISYGKKYPLVRIDLTNSKLNGQRYVDEILRPHLSKHLNYLRRYGQRHARVVEDGAPVHWRKKDKKVREELKIVNFPHPAHSPDLNPIENMWAIVKGKLRKLKRAPTSKEALWRAIEAAWEAIPITTEYKLVHGMNKQLELLKRARGFGIGY